MRYRPLGQSGIQTSVVAFGAWAIGGWRWGGTDAQASVQAIQTGLDAGINFIDTAAVYGFGLSEELVGQAIKDRPRDQIVIATKCGLRWDIETPTLHASSDGEYKIYRTLQPDSIRWEVEQSLRRLGTDYIDLYQPHWLDPVTPNSEAMGALMDLKAEGKILAIGVCNADVDALAEFRAVGPLDSDQERYNMLERERELDNLPYCQEHGLAFLAYSPMAQGLLTGKIGPERTFPPDDIRHGNPKFSAENRQRVAALLAQLQPIADAKQIRMEHLTLAWTLEQPGMSHVLVGARNPEQARNNALAGVVEFDATERAEIDHIVNRFAGLDLT